MPQKSDFQLAHEFTKKWEGGLTDHPKDKGGITAYGVSLEFLKEIAGNKEGQDFLKSLGISLPIAKKSIQDITPRMAETIFKHEFWDPMNLDDLPLKAACFLYDASVNHGRKRAVRFLQTAACILGREIACDGKLGPKTKAAIADDDPLIILQAIEERREFYNLIVKNHPDQNVFLAGWLNRANDQEKYIRKLAEEYD